MIAMKQCTRIAIGFALVAVIGVFTVLQSSSGFLALADPLVPFHDQQERHAAVKSLDAGYGYSDAGHSHGHTLADHAQEIPQTADLRISAPIGSEDGRNAQSPEFQNMATLFRIKRPPRLGVSA